MDLPNQLFDAQTARAQQLLRELVQGHDPTYGTGSFTYSVYDTAWVSLVVKTVDGHSAWLFPACFQTILDTQQEDGGWEDSSSAEVDRVVASLAALLTLSRHIATPRQIPPSSDYIHRRDRALAFLENLLPKWDMTSSSGSDFMLIVPRLLELLSADQIEFPTFNIDVLLRLRDTAHAKFPASVLYSTVRCSAAKNLETRDVDFDRMDQHKISGSIMASPAATAAYLMGRSQWDDEAEAYLVHLTSLEPSGTVPTQYPTTIVEASSVLCALLAGGNSLDTLHLETVADFLEACLATDAGTTGSAPYMESDAINTALCHSALAALGRRPNPQGLIIRFETRGFFKTTTQDRTPSVRTNALVLKALLDLLPENSEQAAQIEKTARFVTTQWWERRGELQDRGNMSLTYLPWLMVDALVQLVAMWDANLVATLDDSTLKDQVFICLYQILTRTLKQQQQDGSWGDADSTAYAVLILTKLAPFSSATRVKLQLMQALNIGRAFLSKDEAPSPRVWREKTLTGSRMVSQALRVAALCAPVGKSTGFHSVESRYQMSLAKIVIQTKYYVKQPRFADVSEWQIQACLIESNLFVPQLRALQYSIFPQDRLHNDNHFETIPFTWLIANDMPLGPMYLQRLMIMSSFDRQLDDLFSNHFAAKYNGRRHQLEALILSLFDESDSAQDGVGDLKAIGASPPPPDPDRRILRRYLERVLRDPLVLKANTDNQAQLRHTFTAFVLARSTLEPINEYIGDQTRHSYTVCFLMCLLDNAAVETVEQSYLVAALCRHLSTISWLSGTVRPASRPQSAINSSFGGSRSVSSASTKSSAASRDDASPMSTPSSKSSIPETPAVCLPASTNYQTQRLLVHERRCLDITLDSLKAAKISQPVADTLNFFINFCELSNIIFYDAKLNSLCTPPTTHPDVFPPPPLTFVQAPLFSSKRPGRTGSVRAARAAIEVAPLILGRSDKTIVAGQELPEPEMSTFRDSPQTRSATLQETQDRESYFAGKYRPSSKASRRTSSKASQKESIAEDDVFEPKSSRASGQTSQSTIDIEQLIAEMGEAGSICSEPMSTVSCSPRPRAVTFGPAGHEVRPAAHRVFSEPLRPTADARLERARKANQERINEASHGKFNALRRAQEAEEAKKRRYRASALQNQAMVEAQRAMSPVTPPQVPTRRVTVREGSRRAGTFGEGPTQPLRLTKGTLSIDEHASEGATLRPKKSMPELTMSSTVDGQQEEIALDEALKAGPKLARSQSNLKKAARMSRVAGIRPRLKLPFASAS